MRQVAAGFSDSQQHQPGSKAKASVKEVVKRCLPEFLLREIQGYRRYKKTERRIYVKLRLLDEIGLGNRKQKAPATARTFVFVCFGNIMRSPMCEALMKRELGDQSQITVISAGLHASPGRTAHPWALAAARGIGITLDNHRAQLLTAEMIDQADAILAMDYQNQVELLASYPQARRRIFMLGAYARDSHRGIEIPDPYYGGAEQTRLCYQVLQECVRNLVSSVVRGRKTT